MVKDSIREASINPQKWENLLLEFVNRAVMNVKPSSQVLRDSMNFNSYIKIKIINWSDNSKSRYVNGVVLSSNLADR